MHYKYLEELFSEKLIGHQEVLELFVEYASNSEFMTGDCAAANDLCSLIAKAAEQVLREQRHGARLEFLLGRLFETRAQYEKAAMFFERALSDSPAKQQIMFALANVYIKLDRTCDAVYISERAFREDVKFDLALKHYAATLYYAGQDERADQILGTRYGTVLVDDDVLRQAYIETGQQERLAALPKRR
jgi:tetratricopeptide (TPR) repeat protein